MGKENGTPSFFAVELEPHRLVLIEIGALLSNGVKQAQAEELREAKDALEARIYTLMGDEERTTEFSAWVHAQVDNRRRAASKNPHTSAEVAEDVRIVLGKAKDLVPKFQVV